MKAERLAPGVYVTEDGALHLDVAELLKAAGYADTPENRQTLVDVAHELARQRWPHVRIEDV